MCRCMSLFIVTADMTASACRNEKKGSDLLGSADSCEQPAVSSLMWVLRTKFQSSGRRAHTLNH